MRLIRFAIGVSLVAVSVLGSARAQSPTALSQVSGQEALGNRFESPVSETVSVIECFETDGGVNYRSDWLIFFNLCGFRLMLQATFLDGVPFDPFSFQQDSWATSEVDVGRR